MSSHPWLEVMVLPSAAVQGVGQSSHSRPRARDATGTVSSHPHRARCLLQLEGAGGSCRDWPTCIHPRVLCPRLWGGHATEPVAVWG